MRAIAGEEEPEAPAGNLKSRDLGPRLHRAGKYVPIFKKKEQHWKALVSNNKNTSPRQHATIYYYT